MTEIPDLTRSRALLIGTTASADPQVPDSPAAAGSLAGMRAVLTDVGLCGWPDDNVRVIQDTSDIMGLSLALHRLAQDATEVLLVYFAGQGLVGSSEEFCLSLAGSLLEDAEETSLRYHRVREEVLDSPARLKIVILDCPYSGHVITGLSGAQLADWAGIRGACVITASDYETGAPVAAEAGGAALTPFTAGLIATIRSGIRGCPAWLTLDDIYSGLVRRLQASGLPEPNRRNVDLAGQVPIARNAAFDPGQFPRASSSELGVAQDQATAARSGLIGRRRFIGVLAAGAVGSAVAITGSQGGTQSHGSSQTNPANAGSGSSGQAYRTLTGPTDQVYGVAFSPDDRFLAVGSKDGNAWIWDVDNPGNGGRPLPHGSAVQAVAFSHQGKLLATGSADGTVRLWETGTWAPVEFSGHDYIFKHNYNALSVAFSPNDAIVASGSSTNAATSPDKTVALCDVTGRRAPVFLPHPTSVGALAFVPPDGAFLLTGSNSSQKQPNNVRKWVVAARLPLYAKAAGGSVAAIACQPNQPGSFVTGAWDGTLRTWNLASGTQVRVLGKGLFNGTVTGVSFNRTGNLLATASTDFIRLWDTKEWRVAHTINNKEAAGVSYSHNGSLLASAVGYLVALRDL
jgi:WD40 repeat protein